MQLEEVTQSWQSWGKVVRKVDRSGKNGLSARRQNMIWRYRNSFQEKIMYEDLV